MRIILLTLALSAQAELGKRGVECSPYGQPQIKRVFHARQCPGGWTFIRNVWIER